MQAAERAAFLDVALAHDLRQRVGADAIADGAHPAAGLHRCELSGVADRDHLGALLPGARQEPFGQARVDAIPASSSIDDGAAAQPLVVLLGEISARSIVHAAIPASSASSRTARPVGAIPMTW